MTVVEPVGRPTITLRAHADRLELEAVARLVGLAAELGGAELWLAVSAVIEEQSGRCSYLGVAVPVGSAGFPSPRQFRAPARSSRPGHGTNLTAG